jgi:putative ABC transport system permease protein
MLGDIQSAVRMLRREKSFAALVVFTLALGIGSTAAVFGMADQLLLRSLPGVHDDGGAAYLRLTTPAAAQKALTTPEFDELRDAATLVEGIASYNFATFEASVGDARGIRASTALIYGDYFEVLGVRPAAGRLLKAAETTFDSDPLRAVISQGIARSLFGSATDAVGKSIYLNKQSFTVVGVTGDDFRGSERNNSVDVWLPLAADAPLFGDPIDRIRGRGAAPHGLFIVRPRSGVSVEAVDDQLREVLGRLARAEPAYDDEARLANVQPRLSPGLGIPPDMRPRIASAFRLLSGVVALVLLISCANAANLLLFRNVARRGPVATRIALGASPGRITREHLVQSLLLGVLGAGAGVGVGWLLSALFRGQSLGSVPAFHGLTLDVRVAAFAVAASIATALLFGTVPAAIAGRLDVASVLRQSGVRHSGRMAVVRSALSIAQLALTLTLGVGALLLVRTVHNLNTADTGLDFHGVVSLWQAHRVDMDRAETDALTRRALAAVEAVPGVSAAAAGPPDLDTPYGGKARVGPLGTAPNQRVDARIVPVTPRWFGIFHVAAVRGRLFSEDDWKEGRPYNGVLTASLARKLFGTEDAVDRTLTGIRGRPELRVIGVVPSLSGNQSPGVPNDVVFVTYAFPPVNYAGFSLVVRAGRFDERMSNGIRSALSAVLPDQPVDQPVPLSAADAHREQETLSHLLVLLSSLAGLLAAVGLYGLIAFVVAGRRREFAVRIAVGATAWRIVRLVLRSASGIVVGGTVLGLGGAYVMSRTLQSRLFGVGPLDPASYLAAATLLGLVAGAACAIPAWRAVHLDPVATLRNE